MTERRHLLFLSFITILLFATLAGTVSPAKATPAPQQTRSNPASKTSTSIATTGHVITSPAASVSPAGASTPGSTVTNTYSYSELGNPMCNRAVTDCHYNNATPTPSYWDGAYMDQNLENAPVSNAYASAVSVLVAFPGSGSPSTFVQSGNYIATGMFAEGFSSTLLNSCDDWGYFEMLYLQNSGPPSVIGEVWEFCDAVPSSSFPLFVFGANWTCSCMTTSNYQNLMRLKMVWGSNSLTWYATVGGVEYSLFSYTVQTGEETSFKVGTYNSVLPPPNSSTLNEKRFQFGVMSQATPIGLFNAYIGSPEYLYSYNSQWTSVEKASWFGAQYAMVDNEYSIGTDQGLNQGGGCLNGGSFPGRSGSMLYGQVLIFPLGGYSSSHGLYDSSCQQDIYPPGASFVGSTPADGSSQGSSFTVTMSNFDSGPAQSGVALCFWSIDKYNGVNWVPSLSQQLIGCNSSQTVTVGSGGNCPYQGTNTCRVNAWTEDWLGNIGGTTTFMMPSDGDAWTEVNDASIWSCQAVPSGTCSMSTQLSPHIVGSKSNGATWTGATGDLLLSYPNTLTAGWDVTKWGSPGNPPVVYVFVQGNVLPYGLQFTFLTSSNDQFLGDVLPEGVNSNSGLAINDNNWHLFRYAFGPNGDHFGTIGNPSWSNINQVSFNFQYTSQPTTGTVYFDGFVMLNPSLTPTSRQFSITVGGAFSMTSTSMQCCYTGLQQPADSNYYGPLTATSAIQSGFSGESTITMSTTTLFDTLSLSTGVSPNSGVTRPSVSITPLSGTNQLTPGSSLNYLLDVATSSATTTGSYTVTVTATGTSSGIVHTQSFSIIVEGDFFVSPLAASYTIPAGGSVTLPFTLSSQDGLYGFPAINLYSNPCCYDPNQPTGHLSDFGPFIPANGQVSDTLYVVTTTATPPQKYVQTASFALYPSSYELRYMLVTVYVTNFSVTASPPSTSNNVMTSTVTVSGIDGFTGSVSLSVSPSTPAGMSCSLGSNSVSLSSTSTSVPVSLRCTAAPGAYSVSVTGTGSGLTQTTGTITFNAPDFNMASSTPAAITSGSAGSSTISVSALNGYTGTVSLTSAISGGPSGTCPGPSCPSLSLSQGSVALTTTNTSPTSTLQISTTPSTPPGTYTATVTGTDGSIVHRTTVTFTVKADFTLTSSSPSPVSFLAGGSTSSTATIQSLGLAGNVTLTSNLTGVSCGSNCPTVTLGTNPVNPTIGQSATSTITVQTTSSTILGSYTLTLAGTSGSLTHMVQLTFTVQDFRVSSVGPQNIIYGTSNIPVGITSINGYAGNVTLSTCCMIDQSGLLASGVTFSFNPATILLSPNATVYSTMTVTVSQNINVEANTYIVEVQGTSNGVTRAYAYFFGPADFTLSSIPPITIQSGSQATLTITLRDIGPFTGNVSLTLSVPSGLTATVNPPIPFLDAVHGVRAVNVTFTVSAAGSTTGGTYTVTLTGTLLGNYGVLSHSESSTVTVQDFSINANPTLLRTSPGATGSSTITLSANQGFTGTVPLAVSSSPSGLSCSMSPATVKLSSSNSTATSTLSCSGSGGDYSITVSGSYTSFSRSVGLIVGVSDFSITTGSIPPLTAGAGAVSPVTLTAMGGFQGTVSLSTSAPSPVTASVNPATVSLFAGGTGLYDSTQWGLRVSGCSCFLFEGTSQGYLYQTEVAVLPSTFSAYSYRYVPSGTSTSQVPTIYLSHFGGVAGNQYVVTAPLPSNVVAYLIVDYTDGTKQSFQLAQSTSPLLESFNLQPSKTIYDVEVSLQVTSGSVTGAFSIQWAFAYSSSLTISTSPSTPQGTYIVTTTGTSGTLSHISNLTVLVPGFNILANPNPLQVVAGSSGTSTITLNSLGGFSGTVTLASSASPSGLTASLNPTSMTLTPGGTGTSTLTLSSTTVGTYIVTVTGTSGSLSHSITITVSVTDFAISASPTSSTFPTGSTGTSTITIGAINGFANYVFFSTTITPSSGLTCSINPYYVYGSGNTTLSCSSYTFGVYTVTVTGTAVSTSHTAPSVSFTVKGFILTVTPQSISILEGRTGSVTITGTSVNGFSGTVGLSAGPNCATMTYSKPSLQISPGVNDSSTLTVTPATTCAANTWIESLGGNDQASTAAYGTYLRLTTEDFSLSAPITNIGIGGSTTVNFNVTYSSNNNYPGSILTQSYSWGPNNSGLSTVFPTTFSMTQPDSNSNPSLVSSLNIQTQTFAYPWNGQGFYAQGRDWIFFRYYGSCSGTTTNCLYYATSTNGVTWTIYDVGVVTGDFPSIVTNGTSVFYVRYAGTDSQSGYPIMLGIGTLHADGTIAWQPEKTVKPGVSGSFYWSLSMRLSTTGQIFVAYSILTTSYGTGYPHVIHSNGRDYTTWQQDTLLANSNDDWRFSLAPLPNGQMYALYWPYWGRLNGTLWSNGAWGPREMVIPWSKYVQQTAFCFTTGNSTVYAIWQDRASQNIQFATRSSSGSWSTAQNIFTADVSNNPHWTASYDPLHGKWYIFYYSYNNNQIWEYSGVPGAWSSKAVVYTTYGASTNTYIGSFYNSALVNTNSNTLGLFWTQYDSSLSTLQLKFANATMFTGGTFAATIPITSTGKGSGTTTLTITASDGYITRTLTLQITINGYYVSVYPNPAGVYVGGSGGTYVQVYPEYGIPLTNSTIVATNIPSCITLGTPSPRYFNVGPVTSLPFVWVPFTASSSCPAGQFPANITITGVSNHSYDKLVTFTIWIQTPPPPCGCGGGSIAYGSLITLADGSRVPVQNLRVGDQMLGYNPVTGTYTISIVQSITVVDTTNMLIIHTASGTPFRVDANPRQTLWVKTSSGTIGWLAVTLIKPGDYLFTPNGWTLVTSIEFAPAGNHVMYDIFASMPYFADGYLDPIRKM